MIIGIKPLVAMGLLIFLLLLGLYKTVARNWEIKNDLRTAKQELIDAREQNEKLVAADRRHSRAVAAANAELARDVSGIQAPEDDGCLDRRIPDAVLAALRVQPAATETAAAPGAGGPATDAAVESEHLPGRAAAHP